ncbi:Protein N-acetyltransferase, RimJ/RimL family [Saccharopolyspora antimicrobica]|uniref:Protein N-acetyltransferase, RimJ/RimL family n=1 Tax=Saccharopolyspora antimicrobica TaxID=455193 RepID=A0A1I5GPT6_9PSEU|nr:GNAT family N-acetyltransferase [Saccharopolyspora antimicrobica]RKT87416.1 RimJ/RimL family protein N-acetyltransferase [Saccharopolyspora antimicrobica]SFO37953.1 Protein N-acetyltransferase, RimJ/RimL family [Saccharopolyspora antimicrobica]
MIEITSPIRTARLVLRPFTERDEDDMLEFESRPDVARYLLNEPRTPEDNAKELAVRLKQHALREEGDTLLLAIELGGKVVGYTLLIWLSRPDQQGEFGYVLHPDHHGKGYASEAAAEMLRIGFEELGLHRIIGRCDPRNAASAGLMERLGMRREGHFLESQFFKGEWGGEYRYALLAEEWRRSRRES